LGCCSVRLGLG